MNPKNSPLSAEETTKLGGSLPPPAKTPEEVRKEKDHSEVMRALCGGIYMPGKGESVYIRRHKR